MGQEGEGGLIVAPWFEATVYHSREGMAAGT